MSCDLLDRAHLPEDNTPLCCVSPLSCRIKYFDHVPTPAATTYNFGVQVVKPNISSLLEDVCGSMSLEYMQMQICE